MGFCRRCGDIVSGQRCKCGGTAVAPVVAWNQISTKEKPQDRWTRTYVSTDRPTTGTGADAPSTKTALGSSTTPAANKRFSRPLSSLSQSSLPSTSSLSPTNLSNRVSAHIASTTSQLNTPAPSNSYQSLVAPGSDILPSINARDTTLSKVYGSILQPKESLATHSCAICGSTFLPDATIYPDPLQPSTTRFLCKPCYVSNGGSKGLCPTCSRPVLTLKSEGGFIHTAGQYWHKGCFNCEGCFKNIGSSPMVDLLGRPSCAECFDNCLKRDRSTPKKPSNGPSLDVRSSIGGSNLAKERKSREDSPAIEELEHRLGIKPRDPSPGLEDLTQRLKRIGNDPTSLSPPMKISSASSRSRGTSPSPQPHSARLRSLSGPNLEATEFGIRGRNNFPRQTHGRADIPRDAPSSRTEIRPKPRPVSSYTRQIPPTPDLASDTSDTLTQFSSPEPDSPPTRSSPAGVVLPSSLHDNVFPVVTKQRKEMPKEFKQPSSKSWGGSVAANSCAGCGTSLFSIRDGGRYITVPSDSKNEPPKAYHNRCFCCSVCNGVFKEGQSGQAMFVKADKGPCHPDCAPLQRLVTRTSQSSSPEPSPRKASPGKPLPPITTSSPQAKSSRVEQPPLSAPPTTFTFPRFGSRTTCPGCQLTVAPMELGVVAGPQGTRWHSSCLICGGKKRPASTMISGRDQRSAIPGCGKKLDSAAKADGGGGVWCRECLLLLGIGGSPQASPTRSSPRPGHGHSTSLSNKIPIQTTGTTTLARQLTGLNDGGLLRQMTGGSMTRSVSPTKQLGSGLRPRPKSVLGMSMRHSKSIDSGRGMDLVRQFTGSSTSTRLDG
ncbi:hypothetical protein BDN72DRAFT_953466 [Pluteus cervinus]|uniref:Uncharacterized protein n=1 Tax=Pluteus cervinus TaxID=181527 RepID=A0ACD3BGT9_9AGAR|nr:hypothetical protein BDN72DRAFT_953466 [Pluteus cervinus]